MSREPTWTGADDRVPPLSPGIRGVVRIAVRGSLFVALTLSGLVVLILLRVLERPLFGQRRPWTPHITQFVCRNAFRLFGMGYRVHGTPMAERGGIVSNHASWMDIFALNAAERVYFVAKSEVAGWPLIGWLARATGTLFIRRDPRRAAIQKRMFEKRLLAGHKLLFFPEGTSTDGQRVLAFKPTLFAAYFSETFGDNLWIQPVSVRYTAPEGAPATFYGWWGDMGFGGHLAKVLASPTQGSVEVLWHAPLQVSAFKDRKALAKAAEEAVRRPFDT